MKPEIFHMKRFDIRQERSAMKIGTDGILIGAWCRLPHQGVVWDIGAGTGVVALMAAQRCNCNIIGVEIDPEAADEASLNIKASPWSDRIEMVCGDAVSVASSLPSPDTIVSNPPFFTTTLKSPDARRSNARHGETLNVQALIELAAEYLSPLGTLSFIAPFDEFDNIEACVYINRLNIQRVCMVSSSERKHPMRVLVQAGRELTPIERSSLCIHSASGGYTDQYRSLTEDFYTHLL